MDHLALIKTLGGKLKVSRAIGINYQTVRSWEDANNIPVQHWPAVIALASESGLHVDEAALAKAAAETAVAKRAKREAANDSDVERAAS